MTKKDYQAIARALHAAQPADQPYEPGWHTWRLAVRHVADVMAADNPRFDRETFVAACEDGNVTRRPKRRESRARELAIERAEDRAEFGR